MSQSKLDKIRHSLAHILAHAVQELYPKTKFGIGPAIENGFYYDFEFQEKISEEDLEKIGEKMKELINQDIEFINETVDKKEAKELFKDQPYKVELIEDLDEDQVSIYKSGKFIDLCKGPHVKSTQEIDPKGFKLNKIAGAYWRGDENNTMLTRIYGLAFTSEKELKKYLERKEEAKERDHRRLGKRMDLFHIDEEVGPGLILWHPKGAFIKRKISEFVLEKYLDSGYKLINTPHIADLKLWEKSGHTDFYSEDMYPPMHTKEEKKDYQIKPMNCPFHMQIYKSEVRSHNDLPLRYTELGTVYRYEKSGVTHGLLRARGFTQDDAHIFCTPEQLPKELLRVVDLTEDILSSFGFKKYKVNLSVRDIENKEKYLGEDERWNLSEESLEKALQEKGWEYQRDEGEAVFYGPKIDVQVEDALGRNWQISTIQVDFNLPERFDIRYRDHNGRKAKPIIIHRALLGSLERFMGVLIEHYKGEFPLWLAPEQIWIIPVGNDNNEYAHKVAERLEEKQLRVKVRDENLTVSKRIRQSEVQKIPYVLVVGDDEEAKEGVRVRAKSEDQGMMKIEAFIQKAVSEDEPGK